MLRPALAFALATAFAAAQDAAALRRAYRDVDYEKIDRALDKAPKFVATPLFAMFVLDLAGDYRVWCALDKTDAELDHYDVLYIDLDGNGDLTDEGERFVGKYDADRARAGMAMTIPVGEIRVPGTDLVHTRFLVSTIRKPGRAGIWFRMSWGGEHEMSGGYGPLGMDVTSWSRSLADAPILRPCPFGPLSFATWGDDEIVLRPGASTHVNVIAGNRGHGPDTLAVVDEHFIDLQRDELLVTVIAKDGNGREVTEISRIDEHC